jgi:hypothetical protein
LNKVRLDLSGPARDLDGFRLNSGGCVGDLNSGGFNPSSRVGGLSGSTLSLSGYIHNLVCFPLNPSSTEQLVVLRTCPIQRVFYAP